MRQPIFEVVKKSFPDFKVEEFDRLLRVFWLNNPNHMKSALPMRLAQRLHSLYKCEQSGGLSLEIEPIEGGYAPVSLAQAGRFDRQCHGIAAFGKNEAVSIDRSGPARPAPVDPGRGLMLSTGIKKWEVPSVAKIKHQTSTSLDL